MNLDGNVRLDQVLEQLGYNDAQPSHHRSNLLHAIYLFAAANHDEYLSWACWARINLIRAENELRPEGMAKEVQVGWDVTTFHQAVKDLNLTTNAGAISIIPVGQDQVKISTLDQNQFNEWCLRLIEAGYQFSVSKPM